MAIALRSLMLICYQTPFSIFHKEDMEGRGMSLSIPLATCSPKGRTERDLWPLGVWCC